MIYRVMRIDKAEVDELSRMPLAESDENYESVTTKYQSEITQEKQQIMTTENQNNNTKNEHYEVDTTYK